MILSDYLIQVRKVVNDVKEQVIDYTFNDDIGLFNSFIHDVEQKVFDNHEGLPDYEWNVRVRTSILQADSKFKGSSCQRNEHLVHL